MIVSKNRSIDNDRFKGCFIISVQFAGRLSLLESIKEFHVQKASDPTPPHSTTEPNRTDLTPNIVCGIVRCSASDDRIGYLFISGGDNGCK